MTLPLHPTPGRDDGPEASAAAHPFSAEYTPYQALGGASRLRTLVDAFYNRMDGDSTFATIRGLHKPDLTEARDKLFWFLSGWLGGPQLYVDRFGHPRLRGRHMPFPIGEAERDQWLACMKQALDELSIEGHLRAFLNQRFAHVANFMRNQ